MAFEPRVAISCDAKESSMLDLLFLGGGVLLLVLLIVYARLCDHL